MGHGSYGFSGGKPFTAQLPSIKHTKNHRSYQQKKHPNHRSNQQNSAQTTEAIKTKKRPSVLPRGPWTGPPEGSLAALASAFCIGLQDLRPIHIIIIIISTIIIHNTIIIIDYNNYHYYYIALLLELSLLLDTGGPPRTG